MIERKEQRIMNEEILELLAEICENDDVKEELDLELFDSGLLDSLGFAEFLVELEERFDVVISPSEVERDEINTPEKILALVEDRR
jgi:D-alanine--poly(phosphoribitol) ligase subunit 2